MPVTDTPPARLALDDIVTGIREIHDHTVRSAATVRADADEKIHALEVTAARLAAERDHVQQENNALVAAAFLLVADSIRREENLHARLDAAAAKARAQNRIIDGLEDLLDDNRAETRRLQDHVRRFIDDTSRLQAELDDANSRPPKPPRRFRRANQP